MKWLVGCIVLLVLCYCAFDLFDNRAKQSRLAQYKADIKAIERTFYNGTIKPLPGPYLEPGKLADLKFKVIELKDARGCKLSENGDVLYSLPSKHPKERPSLPPTTLDYFKLTPDDRTVSFPGHDLVLMKPNGNTVSIISDPNDWQAFSVIYSESGKSVAHKDKSASSAWSNEIDVSAEGFTKGGSQPMGSFEYRSLDMSMQRVPLDNLKFFFVKGSSSDLGDIGFGFLSGMGKQSDPSYSDPFYMRLVFFKNGKVSSENLPFPATMGNIAAAKSVVALTLTRYFWEHIPYLRTGSGSFTAIPVPKGTVQAEVKAINSNREYVLSTLDTYAKQHTSMPWLGHKYYVSKGKYYDIDEIRTKLLHQPRFSQHEIRYSLDERGDLLVDNEGATCLLRRQ